MSSKILYTIMGCIVGAGVAAIPSIVYIAQNTTGQNGPDQAVVVTLMFGPIIAGGAIGYSLA